MRSRNSTFDTSGKRMLSWNEAARYTGLGRTTCRKFAEEADAVRKIGTRVLFDRYALDEALDRAKA